ncbi:MAG: type I methionyl aminopeptidase [Clostridiales bacterium]|jgi:methionyl aminopeptidase|nr:type I methionyl aminopeptidase [Clostridiales bacterium]
MAIMVKNEQQIELMRISNRIVAGTHALLEKSIRPGITTKELDSLACDYIKGHGAEPSFLGYKGASNVPYPASICVSINEEVIHGIPSLKKLKEGDIVSIDIGAFKNGYHGDAARTHAVGAAPPNKLKLIEVTRQCFFNAMQYARAGRHLNEIGAAVQATAEAGGFSVVQDFCGHGIGREMHEDPQIMNYRQKIRGPRLCKGMTLAIEPMVNEGGYGIDVLPDGWTVVTKDRKCSAHYENTILITDGDPEILTLY